MLDPLESRSIRGLHHAGVDHGGSLSLVGSGWRIASMASVCFVAQSVQNVEAWVRDSMPPESVRALNPFCSSMRVA